MDFQESCSAILLALSFLNRKYLSELKVMKFFVQFSKYLIKFIINISFYYFKSITFMFAIYKTLFFTNVIPSIIQLLLTFHYSFDYIWDVYLLVVIYSSLLFGFPYFLFKFNNERIYKNCINAELNFFFIVLFFCFFEIQNSVVFLSNLYYFDLHILRKKAFLDQNEYLRQSHSFTEKALKDLSAFVRENYDENILKIKSRNR